MKNTLYITQEELEKVVSDVIFELYDSNKIPFEMVTGDILNKCYITEGLIKTYSPNQFINGLMKTIPLSQYGIGYSVFPCRNGSNKIYISFNKIKLINEETINTVLRVINLYGWFLAKILTNKGHFKEWNNNLLSMIDKPFTFIIEPKYDTKIEELPEFTYHISPSYLSDKILRNGLLPKSYGKVGAHPDRTYLFLYHPNDWRTIASDFRDMTNSDNKYSLFKISMRNLKSINFYVDQNSSFHKAIYTLEPIPKFAITKIEDE